MTNQVLLDLELNLQEVREAVLNLFGAANVPQPADVTAESLEASEDQGDRLLPPLGKAARRLNSWAALLAAEQRAASVMPEHYLQAMLMQNDTRAGRALAELGVTRDEVLRVLRDLP